MAKSLKKESDWADSGAGTSRPEGSAGASSTAVDSLRSPGFFSSTSSDYDRQVDADADQVGHCSFSISYSRLSLRSKRRKLTGKSVAPVSGWSRVRLPLLAIACLSCFSTRERHTAFDASFTCFSRLLRHFLRVMRFFNVFIEVDLRSGLVSVDSIRRPFFISTSYDDTKPFSGRYILS